MFVRELSAARFCGTRPFSGPPYKTFFYRKWYDPVLARFGDLPDEKPVGVDSGHKYCGSCIRWKDQCNKEKVILFPERYRKGPKIRQARGHSQRQSRYRLQPGLLGKRRRKGPHTFTIFTDMLPNCCHHVTLVLKTQIVIFYIFLVHEIY